MVVVLSRALAVTASLVAPFTVTEKPADPEGGAAMALLKVTVTLLPSVLLTALLTVGAGTVTV